MSEPATVIVFGPSGVGKSTACLAFAAAHPEFQYIRASKVLAEASRAASSASEELHSVATPDQLVLAQEIVKRRIVSRPALIDAHSVLLQGERMVEVPVAAIRVLSPTLLVFLTLPEDDLVLRRRFATPPRREQSKQHIADEQASGLEAAERYSQELHVPLKVAVARRVDVLESLIVPTLKAPQ